MAMLVSVGNHNIDTTYNHGNHGSEQSDEQTNATSAPIPWNVIMKRLHTSSILPSSIWSHHHHHQRDQGNVSDQRACIADVLRVMDALRLRARIHEFVAWLCTPVLTNRTHAPSGNNTNNTEADSACRMALFGRHVQATILDVIAAVSVHHEPSLLNQLIGQMRSYNQPLPHRYQHILALSSSSTTPMAMSSSMAAVCHTLNSDHDGDVDLLRSHMYVPIDISWLTTRRHGISATVTDTKTAPSMDDAAAAAWQQMNDDQRASLTPFAVTDTKQPLSQINDTHNNNNNNDALRLLDHIPLALNDAPKVVTPSATAASSCKRNRSSSPELVDDHDNGDKDETTKHDSNADKKVRIHDDNELNDASRSIITSWAATLSRSTGDSIDGDDGAVDHLHSLPASSFPAALTLLSLSSLRDEVLLHVCRVLLTDQLGYHRCVIYLHHAITPLLRSLATPMSRTLKTILETIARYNGSALVGAVFGSLLTDDATAASSSPSANRMPSSLCDVMIWATKDLLNDDTRSQLARCIITPFATQGSAWTESQVMILQLLFTMRVKLAADTITLTPSGSHSNHHDDDGVLSQLTPPTRMDTKASAATSSSSSSSSLVVQLIGIMRRCSVAALLGSSTKFGQLLLTFITSYSNDARHHRGILLECANNLTTFMKKTTINKLNAL